MDCSSTRNEFYGLDERNMAHTIPILYAYKKMTDHQSLMARQRQVDNRLI